MELVVSITESAVTDLSQPHTVLWTALQTEFMQERPTFPEHISSRDLNKFGLCSQGRDAVGLVINKEGGAGRRTVIDASETSTVGVSVVFKERLREVKELTLDFKFIMLASLPTRPLTHRTLGI